MSLISFYVKVDDGMTNNVSYIKTLTIRDFIFDFLNKIQYNLIDGKVGSTIKLFTFRCNSKILNTKKFLDKKIGDIIGANSTIRFDRKKPCVYGCKIFQPSESSKYISKEYQPGYQNLSYRKVNSGLNIQIKCNNEDCLAMNTIIYILLGFVEDLYFQESICEYCKYSVDPINFWVKDCNYEIKFNQGGKESSITGIADGFGNFVTFNDSNPIFFLRFNVKKR